MYFEKRRRDWKLGRWTAKQAILSCLRLSRDPAAAAALEIIAAPDGAPEAFLDGKAAPVSFSISHSAGVALCAVADAGLSLGCDLEDIRALEANFAVDYFTQEELLAVERAGPEEFNLFVTLIWSAKESVLKALRQGLRRDTRSVRVDVPDSVAEGWRRFTALDLESKHTFHGWCCAREGRVLTVAADQPAGPPAEAL